MIVVAIIGLLAALAIPSFSKARSSTQRTLCLENQRVLFGMVTVYEIEQNKTLQSSAGSGVSIRNTLLNAGYIVKKPIFDCPSSDVIDYDDYTLTYVGSAMTGTKCTVQGNNHFLP
jgi:competence protein ComGC